MKAADQASKRLYQKVWEILERWFRVPKSPPTLPVRPGDHLESFRPADGFLRYLKFQFWIGLLIIDIVLTLGWLALLIFVPIVGLIITPLALAIIILPDIIAYVALHLRYDTTWYVMTDRSIRIRRGIWVINEMTITFENVQNVTITQGPLQRYFGISNIMIQTAGGGGGASGSGQESAGAVKHTGIIEGIANAEKIREQILQRLRQSRKSGLGDDDHDRSRRSTAAWSRDHVKALREIRDALAAKTR